jgi:ADP-ribose pyrophosphatase YjhB (NUDIX family)
MPEVIDSPFYRVAIKAIIIDNKQRLLVTQTRDEAWELPGGGWEHGETFEDCVWREIKEELGVAVATVGDIMFTYRGINRRGYVALRLVVPVELVNYEFIPGIDMQSAKFVSHNELVALRMTPDEEPIKKLVDKIWL